MKDFYKEGKLESILLSHRIYSLKELESVLKKAKAFDIIKINKVSIVYLEDSLDLGEYNKYAFQTDGYASPLIQEEYNLLKELLEDE